MKPNIILIILDALRYDHLSSYGYARPTTPNLDRLAERGMLFENCFSAASWTPPSHASLFTGKYPSRCGVLGKNLVLDNSHLTIAEFLRSKGYRTGATGSAWISRSYGFSYGFEDFIEQWRKAPLDTFSWDQFSLLAKGVFLKARDRILHSDAAGDQMVVNWFKQWATKIDRSKPFFAFLRFLSPHSPYYPLPAFKRQFQPALDSTDDLEKLRHLAKLGGFSFIAKKLDVSEREWEILKAWYDASILYADHLIGQIVDWLRRRDLLKSTIIIVTADHGENFGEHGMAYHVYCVYDTLLHVPLIIRGPEDLIPNGVRVNDLVSLVDVFPSIIDLVDPTTKSSLELDGKSFFSPQNPPTRDRIFAEYGPPRSLSIFKRLHPDFSTRALDHAYKAVRTSTFKYILRSDGVAELFDIAYDPGETVNVLERFPQQAAELHDSIETTLGTFGDTTPVMTVDEEELLISHLRDLGYF